MEHNLNAIPASPKLGNEPLIFDGLGLGFSLIDFWKWSTSDLLSNATRGKLAEFIVGTAIGLDLKNVRNEWAPFDLISPGGIKIEVKSSAYIQSWHQKKYSSISFSIRPARYWDAVLNSTGAIPERSADIYVFCLLKQQDQGSINPLDLDQWGFYVLPTVKLDTHKRSQSSITLNSLKKLVGEITYDKLDEVILECYSEQMKLKTANDPGF